MVRSTLPAAPPLAGPSDNFAAFNANLEKMVFSAVWRLKIAQERTLGEKHALLLSEFFWKMSSFWESSQMARAERSLPWERKRTQKIMFLEKLSLLIVSAENCKSWVFEVQNLLFKAYSVFVFVRPTKQILKKCIFVCWETQNDPERLQAKTHAFKEFFWNMPYFENRWELCVRSKKGIPWQQLPLQSKLLLIISSGE